MRGSIGVQNRNTEGVSSIIRGKRSEAQQLSFRSGRDPSVVNQCLGPAWLRHVFEYLIVMDC
jgi:hypothetical protein